MKKFILSCFLVFFIGCMVIPTNSVIENSQGNFVHWRSEDFPLDVVVSDRLSENQKEAVAISIRRWNREVRSDVFRFREEIPWDSNEMISMRRSTVYILVGDVPDVGAPNETLAITDVSWTNSIITDTRTTLDVALRDEHATLVILHELGHCLGLSHDSWRPSIMYRSAINSDGRIMDDDLNFVRWEMDWVGND